MRGRLWRSSGWRGSTGSSSPGTPTGASDGDDLTLVCDIGVDMIVVTLF